MILVAGPPSVTSEQIHESPTASASVTQSQMAVAVVSTLFVSLAVGFIAGIIFSNREKLRSKIRKQKVDSEKFAMKSINHHLHTMPNGSSSGGGVNAAIGGDKTNPPIHAFEASPKFGSTHDDGGGDVEIALGDCDKSVDENSVNNYNSFTLPKDYKVKKVYL